MIDNISSNRTLAPTAARRNQQAKSTLSTQTANTVRSIAMDTWTRKSTVSVPASAKAIEKYKVPAICQFDPDPTLDDKGYTNASANCGPTSMAMVARAFGYGAGMTNAQLINHMGKIGGTTRAGSSDESIVRMAKSIGKHAVVKGPKPDVSWIASELRAGKLVVVHGNFLALPHEEDLAKTRYAAGHFMLVVGINSSGDFLVHDPGDNAYLERTLTPKELADFIEDPHYHRGSQIAIG